MTDLAHFHVDEDGLFRRCYHKCRSSILQPGFWIGLTLGFPLEHALWEKVPPFDLVTKLFHL